MRTIPPLLASLIVLSGCSTASADDRIKGCMKLYPKKEESAAHSYEMRYSESLTRETCERLDAEGKLTDKGGKK